MGNLSEKRYGFITGSEVHVLFPKKSAVVGQKTYAKKLAKETVFKHRDEVNTWQMDHGHMGEDVAFEWFLDKVDPKAIKPDFKSIGEFGGSADCLTELYGVDFKCPTSLDKWLDYLTDGISNQQYHQAQMYMYVYDRPLWKVVAFLTETVYMNDLGQVYPIDMENRAIVIEVEKDPNWAIELPGRAEFLIEERAKYIEIYRKINSVNHVKNK